MGRQPPELALGVESEEHSMWHAVGRGAYPLQQVLRQQVDEHHG